MNRRGIKNIENPDILERMDGRDMGGMHLGNLAVAQASHYTQPIIGWLRMAVNNNDQEKVSKLLKELDDTNIREAVESISSKIEGDRENIKTKLTESLKRHITPLLESYMKDPYAKVNAYLIYKAWAEDAVKIAGKSTDSEKFVKFGDDTE